MLLAQPDAVTDTTADPAWVPVTVTARLAEPAVAVEGNPLHLDGPAAWGAFLAWTGVHGRFSLPDPDETDRPADFMLPFAAWTVPAPPDASPSSLTGSGLAWGWACSRALYVPDGHGVVNVRKRPALDEAARYARDARWDIGSGPLKARDVPFASVTAREVRWHALADPGALLGLLRRVHHLGRLGNQGNGRVLSWTAEPGTDRDAWRDRVFPDPAGVPGSIRAPYWHWSRKMRCTR